jgi:hypothetical protein
LHSVGNLQAPGSPSKRHRQQGSFARSLRSFAHSPSVQQAELTHSYQNLISSASSIGHSQLQSNSPSGRSSPPASIRRNTDEFGWDMVEDMPLRWATDFVPLASPGSRLSSVPVLCFATWCDETRKGKGTGGQLLAVATKSNIVLYETPKGERAFRFVKVCPTVPFFKGVTCSEVYRNFIYRYSHVIFHLSISPRTTATDPPSKLVQADVFKVINGPTAIAVLSKV